jgi:hypothetical protein
VNRSRIFDLADRIERLAPSHRDPERFHIEKSEIAFELRGLIEAPGDPVTGPLRHPARPRAVRTPGSF